MFNVAKELDEAIISLPPYFSNYMAFVDNTAKISRRYISRGCRTSYIPGLVPEHKVLYEKYPKNYETDLYFAETIQLEDILTEIAEAESKFGVILSN